MAGFIITGLVISAMALMLLWAVVAAGRES